LFYFWVLPVLYALTAIVSLRHPGDEYGLFIISALPGFWATFLQKALGVGNAPGQILPPLILAGAITMAIPGWILDKLRVSRLVWPGIYLVGGVALAAAAILSYPSYERAMGKNGSLTAYLMSSLNLSLYLTCVAAIVCNLVVRLWRWGRERFEQKRDFEHS